jgi:2-polyprenyl-3-methyl-5-hydroxy-6-metoxy-1,4-benzoquinol methylase
MSSDVFASTTNVGGYAGKESSYFANARKEIEPLLPARRCARVLEIGCGNGATLAWLKAAKRCDHAVGVELVPEAANRARDVVDDVRQGDAEAIVRALAGEPAFDMLLCLDVLEHMVDPWSFMLRAQALIAPGGHFVCSLPNVRHHSVIWPLLRHGRWAYLDEGIMDRTHLRFFTLEGAKALATTGGLRLDRVQRTMPAPGSKSRRLNAALGGALTEFITTQYLLSATKHAG